ncbi:TonB-dependent receptor, partial [candidate division KSB1 bacterium]|nr:TonB-dependent receptor [candidate division KSB1 bacterium]
RLLKLSWMILAIFFLHLIVTRTPAADVSGNQFGTWELIGSPYIIRGDVTVPAGQKLLIEPGTIIKFSGFYRFVVSGVLVAQGESNNRIIFTSIHDKEMGISSFDTSSQQNATPNDWNMIHFLNTGNQQASTLLNCIIRFSANAIQCDQSAPTLENIIFADCGTNQLSLNGQPFKIMPGRDYVIPINGTEAGSTPELSVQPIVDIENLLNAEEFSFGEVKVISAALKEQSREEAPAIMTVITADEIKKRGYRSLQEVLRDVPGFDINDNGNWVDTGIRGVNSNVTYGKHIQYLLDGHDMGFKQFTRNLISPSWISMESVKRIEIIRGPGSALWGANAFLGVVNIITKDDEDISEFEIIAQGGSFNTTGLTFHNGKKIGDKGRIFTSFSFYGDNTSTGRKILEWSKIAGEDIKVTNDKEENYSFHFKAQYSDLHFKAHFDRYDPYAPISTFSTGGSQTRFITDRKLAGLSWKPEFKGVKTEFEVTYQNYEFGDGAQYEDNPYNETLQLLPPTGKNPHFIRPMEASDDFLKLSARANQTVNSKFWWIGGIEFENLNSIRWYYPDVFEQESLDRPEFTIQSAAIFAEGQYKLTSDISSTFGLRYDHHSIYGGVTNPRLGLVWSLPKGFYSKLLYGKAFKAPSLHELYYFRKNAFYGNPELEPEKIHTGEILIGYNLPGKAYMSLNYYYSYASDIVSYLSYSGNTPLISGSSFPENQRPDGTKNYFQQANYENYKLQGIEFESKFNPVENLMVTINSAINFTRNNTTNSRLYYTAEKFLGFGISYLALNKMNLYLQGRYVGAKLVPESILNEPGHPFNPLTDETLKSDSYFITDFTLFFPGIIRDNFNLTFKINNLLNTEYYDAGTTVLYAQMPRSYFITFGLKY